VIKTVWGREWDPLLAADADGQLVDKMNTTVDGEFQKYRVETGAYIRKHFFGPGPRLRQLVAHLSDDDLRRLRRGGHDPVKVYASYAAACRHRAAPTVILAKTVKGWALGPDVEARNATHQIKKMTEADLRTFRDRLELPVSDAALTDELPPYVHPGFDSPEYEYLMERRRSLGGNLPARTVHARLVTPPDDDAYQELFEGTSTKVAASTTGAFARLLRNLLRDPGFGPRVVPIIPDEARTFGIDALFRRHKIYAPGGQRYEPVDANLLLSYQEAADGQILEEGITEAGGMASFTAAGTAYATWGEPMLPFFIYYSMFGFHRFADLLWAAGDMRARGFLLGATAGRTTLQGEGLQHCDGHSLLFATAFPNLRAYDPAFAYEVAVIVRDGITRMCGADPEDLLYYLTLYNEGFPQPAMAPGIEEGILAGLYRYQDALGERTHRARILASGTTMLAALDARQMLFADYDIAAEVWSATSYKSLRDDAMTAERWNRLHPDLPPRVPYVQHVLDSGDGPVVAVTDFVRLVVDQVVPWMPRPFIPLGTDGFGLSDTRPALRGHFEVDAAHIVTAVLWGLFLQGEVKADAITDAMRRYGIDPDLPDPRDV
jgi:pyruvate dehydrogenase E1 component